MQAKENNSGNSHHLGSEHNSANLLTGTSTGTDDNNTTTTSATNTNNIISRQSTIIEEGSEHPNQNKKKNKKKDQKEDDPNINTQQKLHSQTSTNNDNSTTTFAPIKSTPSSDQQNTGTMGSLSKKKKRNQKRNAFTSSSTSSVSSLSAPTTTQSTGNPIIPTTNISVPSDANNNATNTVTDNFKNPFSNSTNINTSLNPNNTSSNSSSSNIVNKMINFTTDDNNGTYIDHRPSIVLAEEILKKKKKKKKRGTNNDNNNDISFSKSKKKSKKSRKKHNQEEREENEGQDNNNNIFASENARRSSVASLMLSQHVAANPSTPSDNDKNSNKLNLERSHYGSLKKTEPLKFSVGENTNYTGSNSQVASSHKNKSNHVVIDMKDLMRKLKGKERYDSAMRSRNRDGSAGSRTSSFYGGDPRNHFVGNNKRNNSHNGKNNTNNDSNENVFYDSDVDHFTSRPPSRSDSDNSSLGDVCLPLSSDDDYGYDSDDFDFSDDQIDKNIEHNIDDTTDTCTINNKPSNTNTDVSGLDVAGDNAGDNAAAAVDSNVTGANENTAGVENIADNTPATTNNDNITGARITDNTKAPNTAASTATNTNASDSYNNTGSNNNFTSTTNGKQNTNGSRPFVLRSKIHKKKGNSAPKKQWPDVSVLEEFRREETSRLKRQAMDYSNKFLKRTSNLGENYDGENNTFNDIDEQIPPFYDDASNRNNHDNNVSDDNATGYTSTVSESSISEDSTSEALETGTNSNENVKSVEEQKESDVKFAGKDATAAAANTAAATNTTNTNAISTKTTDNKNNAINPKPKIANGKQKIEFSYPIVTNVDVPELENKKVNETEVFKSGRLRPKKLKPWDWRQQGGPSGTSRITSSTITKSVNNRCQDPKNNNAIPGLNSSTGVVHANAQGVTTNSDNYYTSPALANNNNNGITSDQLSKNNRMNNYIANGSGGVIQYPPQIISNNPEHFRFAYFRDDLDATVHSPTISGLLQPGQTYADLFIGSVYARETQHDNKHNQPNKNIEEKPLDFDDIAPFWLDVLNPTEEEMKVISKAFGIHPLTTEDIFLGEAREKVELFRHYYLVCFRSFDIVAEKHKQKSALSSHTVGKSMSSSSTATGSRRGSYSSASSKSSSSSSRNNSKSGLWRSFIFKTFGVGNKKRKHHHYHSSSFEEHQECLKRQEQEAEEEAERQLLYKRKSGDRHKPRAGELEPLNVYILVFRTGVITFHFAPTPHPINVRRRARLIKDYINVTADWIAYALIDDITDAFGPIIELIEDEVYDIENAILNMHHGDDDDGASDFSSDSDSDSDMDDNCNDSGSIHTVYRSKGRTSTGFARSPYEYTSATKRNASRKRSGSHSDSIFSHGHHSLGSNDTSSYKVSSSSSSASSSSISDKTLNPNIIGWKRKGDMLRRIGECRKRVMSVSRLLGSKADVIKSFAKRCNEDWEVAPKNDIGMYLGDIQDHIVTMVSSLNHFEKLLSRSHSNYLAQINIDMTKVNNDMNDVLGKITILGTVVLPMNVITGLWGMNCIVPGQNINNLAWFFSIVGFMALMAIGAFIYTKKRFGF
ncbi:uncharacterized protein SCODWIG_01973 [Saccharomycodes ludwigii]|uniref:Manganese resistance protein MNR2 n=1 Tax=Saccharomycodes ludwigii TaxID=36035 RepID=A0A376B6E1_9ASCO|nr:uncharacterized protein SCODWIG_01973 [Saccharomycodes ludwigii]